MPPKSKATTPYEDESVGGLALGCCVDPGNYVWMVVALFAFTVLLAALCCTSCIATRWIYKRRMKRKCEGLREKYRKEAEQRRESALAARRIAMRPPIPALRVEPSKEVLAKFVQLGRMQQQNADMRTAKETSTKQLVQAIASNQAFPTQQNAIEPSKDEVKLEAVNISKTEEVNVSLRRTKEKSINLAVAVPPDTVAVEPTQTSPNSLPLDPTPPLGSSTGSDSGLCGSTVPNETPSAVSIETQKDSSTQSKDATSSSNSKPTASNSTAPPTTASEATSSTPSTSEAPSAITNSLFPYFSGPGNAQRTTRNKRSAWIETSPIRKEGSNPRNPVERKMSSTSVSPFVTAGSRPPNAYDLRRMVLQGKGLRSDPTQPTSSMSRESVYNHLRTLNKKDPLDCLKSVSLNGLPATREKK